MGKIAVRIAGCGERAGPTPWWALLSSSAAPVFLVGGFVAAQLAQPDGVDAVHDTISALARQGLDHRWIMTGGLAGLGVCHVVTSLGLRRVRIASRAVLALAGIATFGVAAFPQPYVGSSNAHTVTATTAFVALALWPATTASRRGEPVLRPVVAVPVTVVSLGLLVWFGRTLGGGPEGLSERVLAVQQALWPLAVAIGLRARSESVRGRVRARRETRRETRRER